MSFLRKLKFWKKEDFDSLIEKDLEKKENLGLESSFDEETLSSSHPNQSFFSSPARSPFQENIPPSRDKELELINSKLDTLKVTLGSIEQRIINLEKNLEVEQKKKERLW